MINDTSTRRLSVRNPRSGEIDHEFSATSDADIKNTVTTLRNNQRDWVKRSVEDRISVIRQWQKALLDHQSDIVSALSLDTGRRALAQQEFDGMQKSLDRWCSLAPSELKLDSQNSKALPDVEIYQDIEPYPVLGAISPWNFPFLLSFIDVTPALLAGCAAIIKPSEVTPRFADPVVASIAAVPELAAVLAFCPGDGLTGAELIKQVDVVAFTGSVATGKKVAIAAAECFIPAYLELGGKDPVIVLEGSDLDRATTAILRASAGATGQACQSLERLYVARTEYGQFVSMLTEKAKAAKLSKPDPTKGIIGPLIFAKQAEIISSQLEDAMSKGAKIECGGNVENDNNAFWIEPTVLSNVDHSMLLMTEETFGPVMPVMAFDSVEQAIKLANDSIYGLSAAVFGPDDDSAMSVARQINAGGVSVNDAGLTTMIFETEKSAFGYSGMGPSRVGSSGMSRFLRKKSLYLNRGNVMPISVFNEN